MSSFFDGCCKFPRLVFSSTNRDKNIYVLTGNAEGAEPLRKFSIPRLCERVLIPGYRANPFYVRGGKTPCNAMQKLSVRYGCMLLCGRLPPAG